eukprot:TRINITY_DN11277_c0_g1_i1.p1 TRINITY_DN11277_c0_g1~~TRINITY_DN11277_c0_g1_i1.p1  ORF type:complete len:347 (+),score=69.21 TRINITY_DN11277_c0_g1_i1:1655-2695(+)
MRTKLKPVDVRTRRELEAMENDDAHVEPWKALPLINLLKKLCNTPDLVLPMLHGKASAAPLPSSVESMFLDALGTKSVKAAIAKSECHVEWSGKMLFMDRLMSRLMKGNPKEKVVIVSNYTQTLHVIASLLNNRNVSYFQLDGSTPVKKRQEMVDDFNNPRGPEIAFLLSSKAGGCGLNLIGANHLILCDGDWNPSNDAQAMARVWRPGQKKDCYIYRLICTGTIEEKIYQRQVTKMALSSAIVEKQTNDTPNFSTSDLKDLFTLREDTKCDTHDLLCCRCCASSSAGVARKRSSVQVSALMKWKHTPNLEDVDNELLSYCARDIATFAFSQRVEKEDDESATSNS